MMPAIGYSNDGPKRKGEEPNDFHWQSERRRGLTSCPASRSHFVLHTFGYLECPIHSKTFGYSQLFLNVGTIAGITWSGNQEVNVTQVLQTVFKVDTRSSLSTMSSGEKSQVPVSLDAAALFVPGNILATLLELGVVKIELHFNFRMDIILKIIKYNVNCQCHSIVLTRAREAHN